MHNLEIKNLSETFTICSVNFALNYDTEKGTENEKLIGFDTDCLA